MSAKDSIEQNAKLGRFFAHRCSKCGRVGLPTAYFCQGCGGREHEGVVLEGTGSIATYTIITVPPAGFESLTPYAFVVLKLDGADLRVSGFMAGISSPEDLPVGTRARIAGFDGRGILVEKAVK